jgi:hypothetical protein
MIGIHLGLSLPNRGVLFGITTADELVRLAERAEASGVFGSVWGRRAEGMLAAVLETAVFVKQHERDLAGELIVCCLVSRRDESPRCRARLHGVSGGAAGRLRRRRHHDPQRHRRRQQGTRRCHHHCARESRAQLDAVGRGERGGYSHRCVDAGFFVEHRIRAVMFGAGDPKLWHTDEEVVRVADLVTSARALAYTAVRHLAS